MTTTAPETQHLIDITESVWTRFLGIGLAPVEDMPPPRAECAASIAIEGAWNGVVVVCCSQELARRAAAAMFHCKEPDMTESQWRDALNEVVNIIGGNVKSLLPGPSRLELPVFQADWVLPRDSHMVTFHGNGEPLQVLLVGEPA